MKTERLLLIDVETGDRLRAVDPAKVAAIKASIADIGLRTPITVAATRDGDDWHFRLVAGAHRLEALRQLGEEFADCFVMEGDQDDAALWEIDENFARAELTDAQRADHHVRREAILVRKGLAAKPGRGGDRSNGQNVRSYAKQASETLGVDERTVRRDLARGKNIAPDVLSEVAGTPLDKGVVLDELARTPQAEQHEKLSEIAARHMKTRSLAPDPLNDAEATEKQLAALMSAWNRAGPEARERFMETVDTRVFDRGRG